MNNRVRMLSGAVLVGMTLTAMAGGLQPGDRCAAFDVNAVTVPHKGTQLCYV